MSHLKTFVDRMNAWNKIMKKPTVTINSPKDREVIRNSLECELSPENLCCDGELSGRALRIKADYLNGALAELNARG